MSMKRLLLFATVAAAIPPGAALSADMRLNAPAQVVAPFGWAGLYVGVNAGYGWGTSNSLDATFAGVPAASISPSGGFGGLQAGYNGYLTPHWMLGSEFDFDWGDISGSATAPRSIGGANNDAINVRFFGTARERVGYVMDRSLIYVTGGVAWASGNWTTNNGSGATGSIRDDHVGWTVGAGYEYAFAPRWSAKVEYLYSNFGQWQITENFGGGGARNIDLKLNTVRFGLNYRLDDAPPAVSASSMPLKAPAAAPLSWAGSYVGVQAGYGWGTYDLTNTVHPGPASDAVTLNPNGFLGGFGGGYNWLVTPAFLVGVESDFAFGSLNASGTSAPFGLATNVQINDFGTVRARFGVVVGQSLLYATGGFAYAQEKAFQATPLATTTRFFDLGWTAGAGVEYMFAPRWSAKLEYLYARLDSTRSDTAGFDVATKTTINTVRAGVNYKFDWADILGRL